MQDQNNLKPPVVLAQIQAATAALGFEMASEPLTGSLLRTLAAAKPAGKFLELGTGTGVATAWLLDGMDRASHLITVENDPVVLAVAKQYLGHDRRINLYMNEAGAFLETLPKRQFDLIFADTWAGKFTHLEEALQLLRPSGFYVIDDMLPQANWPEGHASKVRQLIAILESRSDLILTKMNWSSGMMIATKLEA